MESGKLKILFFCLLWKCLHVERREKERKEESSHHVSEHQQGGELKRGGGCETDCVWI